MVGVVRMHACVHACMQCVFEAAGVKSSLSKMTNNVM